MLKKCVYVFSKKQKRKLIILFFMILVSSILELLGISAILPLVNIISNPEVIHTNSRYDVLVKVFGTSDIKHLILACAILLIVVYVLKNAFLCMVYYWQYKFTFDSQRELSYRLMQCYINQDYLFHTTKNVADLQRNVMEDVRQFFLVVYAMLQLLTELSVCAFIMLYLLSVDTTTTLTVVALVVVYLVFYWFFIRKKISTLGELNRKTYGLINKWVLQSFGGIKEVKVLNRESYFLENYCKTYHLYSNIQTKQQFLTVLPRPIMETVSILGILVSMVIQILSGADFIEFIPILSVFVIAAIRMLPSFSRVASHINTIIFSKASVHALYDDIIEAEKLIEQCNSRVEQNMSVTTPLKNIEGNIELCNVTFSYPNTESIILDNVNLTIENKSAVAFIGESGSGKTTLADIILGILEPDIGKVYVGECDIFQNMQQWHRAIGYIPQNIYLMDDTIEANIAFGIPKEQIDERRLHRAIVKAQLERYILTLPEGVNTLIGDRGIRISGGQRQRIGIARALYNEPSILVLDEATSALDGETENAVMDAISSLQGDITMIIIAHRLSTIQKCDKIYEVKAGHIYQKNKEDYCGK